MTYHAQNVACHLLSYFSQIDRDESFTGITFVSPRARGLCRKLLPRLIELANLSAMLTTIVRPLLSYERSELHSTIDAARQFLHSDLKNVRRVVSKWTRNHPHGLSAFLGHHIGSWEYVVKPVARPTARIVIPPSNTPTRVYIPTRPNRSSTTFSSERTARTVSVHSQESRIADIIEALELAKSPTGRTRSDSESSGSDSSYVATPNNDILSPRFDYFEADHEYPVSL
ncbi:PP-loop family domain-containing protein [Rhizoctonia solani AG-1 IA]|uniref:PP-loop family domain-containing protein n=1 Tax=Thanatephorus cucumeris (strain AG1-IA) TaxID=983506 RepID=L8WSD0_THACA|nr:PP-loop family domain-containing protein [Rhizoctonia solani AG-1 IA]